MAEVTIWGVETPQGGRIKRFDLVNARPVIWTESGGRQSVGIRLAGPAGDDGMPDAELLLDAREMGVLSRALTQARKIQREING